MRSNESGCRYLIFSLFKCINCVGTEHTFGRTKESNSTLELMNNNARNWLSSRACELQTIKQVIKECH